MEYSVKSEDLLYEPDALLSSTSSTVPEDIRKDIMGELNEFGEEDDSLRQGCWQKFLFFVKHSFRDLKRHICHYCLAFCSVYIVVLSTLVVNTVTDQGPIIFVNLAQGASGQYDVWYYGYITDDFNQNSYGYSAEGYMLNYTRVQELYGDKYNLAPRYHSAVYAYPEWQQYTETLMIPEGYNHIYFYDKELEKDINVGTSWPYNSLQPDECILSSDYKDVSSIRKGDKVVYIG